MFNAIKEFVKKHKKAIVKIVGGFLVVTLVGIVVYKIKLSEVPVEQIGEVVNEVGEEVAAG